MNATLRARRTVSTAMLPRITGASTSGLPLEDEVSLADRDPVAGLERRPLDAASVHLDAVRGAEVDDDEAGALAAQLGVLAGDVRIGDLHVALARAADHCALAGQLAPLVAVDEERVRIGRRLEVERGGGRGGRAGLVDLRHPWRGLARGRVGRGRAVDT